MELELENQIATKQQLLDQQRVRDLQLLNQQRVKDLQSETKQNTAQQQSDPPSQRVLRKRTTPDGVNSSQATSKAPRTTKAGAKETSRKQKAQHNPLPVSDGFSVDNPKHRITENLVVDTGASHTRLTATARRTLAISCAVVVV